MPKKDRTKRIDTGGDPEPLTDNPFAALGGLDRDALPEAPEAARPASESPPPAPFTVERTRKGGWPVRVERRPGGRSATVVDRVSGDAKALLGALKTLCGAGGTVREGAVEVQGDHAARIAAWLDANLG
jgi:translation initiation factor 1